MQNPLLRTVVFAVSISIPHWAWSQDDDAQGDLLLDVKSAWDVKRAAISSLLIEANRFRKGSSRLSDFAPEEVRRVISELDWNSDAALAFNSLILSLRTNVPESQPIWAKVVFAIDGENFADRGVFDFVSNGESLALDRKSPQQIDLYLANACPYGVLTLPMFMIEADADLMNGLAVRAHDGERLYLVRKLTGATRQEIEVETSTRLVRRVVTFDGEVVVKEVFQLGTIEGDDGVIFPEGTVACEYKNGRIYSADILMITSLTMNHPVPDQVMKLSAPSGTNVFDYRSASMRHIKLTSATNDLLSHLPAANIVHPQSENGYRIWFVTMNVLIIVVIVALILRKRIASQFTSR